jgi:hypothetical protein
MKYDYEAMFAQSAQKECKRVADMIADEIKSSPTTPTVTGKLRNSYKSRNNNTGAEVVSTVDYWKYVEYGHHAEDGSWVDAQPHVRPAIQIVKTTLRS